MTLRKKVGRTKEKKLKSKVSVFIDPADMPYIERRIARTDEPVSLVARELISIGRKAKEESK